MKNFQKDRAMGQKVVDQKSKDKMSYINTSGGSKLGNLGSTTNTAGTKTTQGTATTGIKKSPTKDRK